MDQIKFYNSENIPLPALIPLAFTQELRDELLIRQLNIAFNEGREFEKDTMALTGAKEVAKVVNDALNKPKTVTVSIELPEPPDGWEWDGVGKPVIGQPYLSSDGTVKTAKLVFTESFFICCRRIWTPPANAVGTFYPHEHGWHFTDGTIEETARGDWRSTTCTYVKADSFSDFVPPPERRPYRVVNGVEVKESK